MQNGFVKGMLVGGLLATSVGMMMNSDRMNTRVKRRVMRNGRTFLKRTGNLIGDVVDMFR